ncbi:MAG: Nramp family divalent metal transporter [Verrucomicrobiota bacterium]
MATPADQQIFDAPSSAVQGPELPRTFAGWMAVFGPGAVIASLTIGAGELIFSSRAGSIFGYRVLWFFLLVLLLKWVLVYTAARQMVLTGAHPFQRWMEFPGPRGWFPMVLVILAILCFPIWVCFHSGTIGTLLAAATGTHGAFAGAAHYVWGMGILAVVLVLCVTGGYAALEKIQLAITLIMLGCVTVALFLIQPDWFGLMTGALIPQSFHYPPWLTPETHPEFAHRAVWVEAITYVGVLGGSSYDYLAYVSYLRDKRWGQAGRSIASRAELHQMEQAPAHPNRRWIRAILIDATLSFLAVLVFTIVFVACGAAVLGPQQKIPGGSNLLAFQSEFVTAVHPALSTLYFAGAFLAILGTLYGTIEVAPTVLREMAFAFNPEKSRREAKRLRLWAIGWVCFGGFVLLTWSVLYHLRSGQANPPGLIALLTPANLFTGVLGCGLVCLLTVWAEFKYLPKNLRFGPVLVTLTLAAGVVFVALGFKGYWDWHRTRWIPFAILAATLGAGWFVAWIFESVRKNRSRD